MSNFDLTDKELHYLTDSDFLITKNTLIDKIFKGLNSCSRSIDLEIRNGNYGFVEKHLKWVPKVSKGENYHGLPYLVLDNPRFFKKNEIVNYRILLWWGNHISFSMHLEGGEARSSVDLLISKKKKNKISDDGTFYCIGKTPWEHHFKESNYLPLISLTPTEIQSHFAKEGFCKIARKATLQEWPFLKDLAIKNLQILTDLTTLGQRS